MSPDEKGTGQLAGRSSCRMGKRTEGTTLRIDEPAQRMAYDTRRTRVELRHATLQKPGVAEVVALGDPDVLATCQFEAAKPLPERRTAVRIVADDVADARLGAIAFKDRPTAVGRGIVKQDHLDVPVALTEHAPDALLQPGRMTIVGDNDRYHYRKRGTDRSVTQR